MRCLWLPAASLLLGFGPVLAASAPISDLGVLPQGSYSQTTAISADGQVVIGLADDTAGTEWLFRWTAEHGVQPLGNFAGYGLSGDGSVMVGTRLQGGVQRAFRWQAGVFTDLGTFGGDASIAWSVSGDGSVVVGEASDAAAVRHAFRWTAATGLQALAQLQVGGSSLAYALSADGAVAVGTASSSSGARAVIWQGSTLLDLGTLGTNSSSGAFGVNADGSVVVGNSGPQAFRWTAGNGMQDLGTLGGTQSAAAAVSADGNVVVGFSALADGSLRAYRWTQATGMTSLGLLSGGTYSEAIGISADGSVVIGTADNAQGGDRAVIWKEAAVQDLGNLRQSVLDSAGRSARLTEQQAGWTRALGEQACIPGALQRYCLSGGAGLGNGVDASQQGFGVTRAGLRLTPHLAIGGSLGTWRDLHSREPSAYGLGIWLHAQQDAATHLGWQATASLAASDGHGRLQRGEPLADVQRASTRIDLRASAEQLALGYGFALGTSLLTPQVAVSHVDSERSGFTEHGVVLPLQVRGAKGQATYASLGASSDTPLGPRVDLHLHLALERLLSEHDAAFSGTSQIPGLAAFALPSELARRPWRPAASAQLRYALNSTSSLAGEVQVAASPLAQRRPLYGVGVEYRYAF